MTSATPMIEAALLPCPFCFSDIHVEIAEMSNDRHDKQWFEVVCDLCECSGPKFFFDPEADEEFSKKQEAIAAWNRRTPAPSTPVAEGIVERLHELIGEYFDLGYAEGVAGRDADTVGGDAQRGWSEIASTIAALSEENRLSMQTIADERERADKAEAALATARNDAIEDAAKVAEKVGISAVLGRPLLRVETVPIDIAKAIRSLKGDSTP